MQRMGMVIGLKPDKIEAYKRLHTAVWPDILAKISECHIANYSIYLKEPENLLFGYWMNPRQVWMRGVKNGLLNCWQP